MEVIDTQLKQNKIPECISEAILYMMYQPCNPLLYPPYDECIFY